jgi:hypothetical protein
MGPGRWLIDVWLLTVGKWPLIFTGNLSKTGLHVHIIHLFLLSKKKAHIKHRPISDDKIFFEFLYSWSYTMFPPLFLFILIPILYFQNYFCLVLIWLEASVALKSSCCIPPWHDTVIIIVIQWDSKKKKMYDFTRENVNYWYKPYV